MATDRSAFAALKAAATEADTLRGLNYTTLFDFARAELGPKSPREVDPLGKGERVEFFTYPVSVYLDAVWTVVERLAPRLGRPRPPGARQADGGPVSRVHAREDALLHRWARPATDPVGGPGRVQGGGVLRRPVHDLPRRSAGPLHRQARLHAFRVPPRLDPLGTLRDRRARPAGRSARHRLHGLGVRHLLGVISGDGAGVTAPRIEQRLAGSNLK
jgi:hypothetical protein